MNLGLRLSFPPLNVERSAATPQRLINNPQSAILDLKASKSER
jgi:hypothetical protein